MLQYLHALGMSPSNITNFLTAIRSMYIAYGLDTMSLREQRIPMFIKAITINRSLDPSLPITIDENILANILQVTHQLPHAMVYQSFYLLCFFSEALKYPPTYG